MPEVSNDRIGAYAEIIESLRSDGNEVGIVVGGGTIAREYIEAARALKANEIELDQIGIDITRLNARLLIAGLSNDAVVRPAHTYEEAKQQLIRSGISVLGGTCPAQTTDAVSAAFAEFVEADLLVFATSVSGVYTDDPNEVADATKFDRLTPAELLSVVSDLEMNAGSPSPVDALAAKVIQRSGMRAIVIDGNDPNDVLEAIRTGSHEGTDIEPEHGVDGSRLWQE